MQLATGEGLPVKLFIEPSEVQIGPGQTVALRPTLTDVYGTVQLPAFPFRFRSSRPDLLTVDSDGLCSATSDASVTPGRVVVRVSYPYANRTNGDTIEAEAVVYMQQQLQIHSRGL